MVAFVAVGLSRQRFADFLDRVATGAVAGGLGPVQDGTDALPNPAGGLLLGQPDRRQCLEDFGGVDLIDAAIAEGRIGVALEGVEPLVRTLGVLPRLVGTTFRARRFSAKGSRSLRAIARYFLASSRASARDTSLKPPKPMSHRLPLMTVRSSHRLAPEGATLR